MFTTRLITCSLSLALAATLVACGGGAPVAPASVERSQVRVHESLFDDRGRPQLSPVSLMPVDTAARTRAGLYATAAQLEWEMLMAASYTVLLDVDLLGSVTAAVLLAEQVRGLRDTRGLAFFVRARQAGDAARVVDTLVDAGFAPVFLIV